MGRSLAGRRLRLDPTQAARGLFAINPSMLVSFMTWGSVVPRLYARGWTAQRLIARGAPVSPAALALALLLGPDAGAWVRVLGCAGCSVVSLSQPAVGLALPAGLAGRALSAYNLVIFLGVFGLQWGIGLAIDLLRPGLANAVSLPGRLRVVTGLLSDVVSVVFVSGRAGEPRETEVNCLNCR